MNDYRRETDLLGDRDVPADALWGIHALRATENFPLARRPVNRRLVHAFGAVKLAAAQVNHALCPWDDAKFAAIEAACREMIGGELDRHVVVDALQGGAGTSTNMNVNEVLANRALQRLGRPLGDYQCVNPHDDLNRHQSTNDTYPTALKVAAIIALHELEPKLVVLMEAFQQQEKRWAEVVKIGRTELQDAVLVTLGREMGAYAEAIGRDRWRIYKCEERLRVVNLGGTAVGTGLGAPRQYIFRVVEQLREVTGLGLARAENLIEATQNADALVEVSGILRTLAVNLLKIANDLRLLSSGPRAGLGEIRLPPRQAGSSIMPGKVNPVILEAVAQVAIAVIGYDQMTIHAIGGGNLELSQFLPLAADSLLGSLDLLIGACDIFARHCVAGIEADVERCRRELENSTALLTALVGKIGYEAAEEIARQAADGFGGQPSIRQSVIDRGLLTAAELESLIAPQRVMKLGSE
jgi:aspartate ammonia-lyase